jgi:multiple sugar transport system ATP-binding protein
VREPNAFLMDEPLSNLDARLRVHMRTEIARLQKMTGVTTIYVTHDQVEAMTMGDRVAVMNRGALQQFAPPRTLYHEPANLFVANFIGSPAINLLEGKVLADESGCGLQLGTKRLKLPAALLDRKPAIAEYVGRTVAVGLRPETLTVGEPGAGAIMGVVSFVEDLGASLLVHFQVDAAPPRLDGDGLGIDDDETEFVQRGERGRVRAAVNGFASMREGERAPISIDLERIHLFDRRTGLVIGAKADAQNPVNRNNADRHART